MKADHQIGWTSRAATLVAALLLLAKAGSCATLTVNPLRVDLPADGSPAIVEVTNRDPSPVLVRVDARDWQGDIDSSPRSTDLIAVPPVFEVQPEQKQIIRIALRRPLEDLRERAYRLIVAEVPKEVNSAQGISFLLRFSLPAFATPQGAAPAAEWMLSGRELRLENGGTAHLRVKSIELASGGSSIWQTSDAAYALAGESVSWPLGKSLAELPATMEVRAETNRGPITATVTRPGG